MKVSTRRAITSTIERLAAKDEKIYVVCTDSKGSVTADGFAEKFPGRFLECGIAEQNAVSLGAGLASTGKTVFVAGPACFMSTRAYEQIKVDVSYNDQNVKIIGVSGGVSYGPLGATHTSLNDVGAIRTLFNMEIFLPADDIEAKAVIEYVAKSGKPAYVRVGRGDTERVFSEDESFEIGKAKVLRVGEDVTIIASGETVWRAIKAAEILENSGIKATVVDMCRIKPLDEETLLCYAKKTGAVLTVEEHSVIGGLGEAVVHALSEEPVAVKILGFPDEELVIGKPDELFSYYHLDPENVASGAEELVRRKKKHE